MTFMELRSAIVRCLNEAKDMTPDEIYGVVASVEAEVRFMLIKTIPRDEAKPLESKP